MKNLVKFSFSRFAESYEKHAILQKEAAEILADFSGELKGKGIDLGCGTGFLYEFFKKSSIIGIDISTDMISFYRKRNRNAVVCDMEKLPFLDKSFNFAISNFSLHWSDIEKTFSEVKRVLKENGVFIFNIPIYGSLESVENILGNLKFDFPCVPETLKTLKEKGFGIEDFFVENLEFEFENGYELLSHLHKTGVSISQKRETLKEKRKTVEKFLSYKKPVKLNFKLLFVKAYVKFSSH